MTSDAGIGPIVVREALPEDAPFAAAASELIRAAASEHDIAERSVEWLTKKIVSGRAAVALDRGELIGFGYWSDWQDGAFVSHSGLVVDPQYRGRSLGRRLKMVLFESSKKRFPQATLMSLTTSPQVKALNLSLGFRVVPLEELTSDPAFWAGCQTCRNYAAVQARGEICCCEGMILRPEGSA